MLFFFQGYLVFLSLLPSLRIMAMILLSPLYFFCFYTFENYKKSLQTKRHSLTIAFATLEALKAFVVNKNNVFVQPRRDATPRRADDHQQMHQ